jgi:hypothetical protein
MATLPFFLGQSINKEAKHIDSSRSAFTHAHKNQLADGHAHKTVR